MDAKTYTPEELQELEIKAAKYDLMKRRRRNWIIAISSIAGFALSYTVVSALTSDAENEESEETDDTIEIDLTVDHDSPVLIAVDTEAQIVESE